MRFRKDSLLLAECEIYTFLLIVLCVTLIQTAKLCYLMIAPMFILMAIYPILFNEFIMITESGICCTKQEYTLWAFSWNEIAELRKSRRFRQNSIEIILPNEIQDNCSRQEYYFQMSRTAKTALQKYSSLVY